MGDNTIAMKNMAVLCEARAMLIRELVTVDGAGITDEVAARLESAFAYAMKSCAECIEVTDRADA